MVSLQDILNMPEIKTIKQTLDENSGKQGLGYVSPFYWRKPEVVETLRLVSLRQILTSDMTGAHYLVPEKLYQVLVDAAYEADISELLVAKVLKDVDKITKEKKDTLTVEWIPEGADIPSEAPEFEQISVSYKKAGRRIAVTEEMVEDAQWDLIEWQMRRVGTQMGLFKTKAVIDEYFGASGINTYTTASAGVFDIADLAKAMNTIEVDLYDPTIAVVHRAAINDIRLDTTNYNLAITFREDLIKGKKIPDVFGVAVVPFKCDSLEQTATDRYYHLVCDPKNAGFIVQKRPLTIKRYADPVKDLAGAVVTERYDIVVLWPEAICKVTEAA